MSRTGHTQATLAPHVHMSTQALSERMRGLIDFRIGELITIATVLNVPVADLIDQPNTVIPEPVEVTPDDVPLWEGSDPS